MTRRRAQLARAGYFSDIILGIRFTPEILPNWNLQTVFRCPEILTFVENNKLN
jgi:hypothetical protein